MHFQQIINSKLTQEPDRPLMQKDPFPVTERLQNYLQKNGRDVALPIAYTDLLYYSHANSLRDKKGKLTHWETAVYDAKHEKEINTSLIKTYAILKKNDSADFIKNISASRIDFCEFGNSIPFRIEISFKNSGATDHYYIKMADASRIYGLELEHLLSPDATNFIYHNNTLVEEHIAGIPGDVFLKNQVNLAGFEPSLLAKEFIKFNERCFARLLGDMRSYNFVVDTSINNITAPYRIRAIDFDQQSYEGRMKLYLPQFYKENHAFVEMVLLNFRAEEIALYQQEERACMRKRVQLNRRRLMELMNSMVKEELSENYKVALLRNELNEHYNSSIFSSCKTMGCLVKRHLKQLLS